MLLTELPLGLPGRVFRSSMPFSQYDPQGNALREYRSNKIALIVLLAEAEECIARASMDLRAFYLREGFQVLPLPIADFGVRQKTHLRKPSQRSSGMPKLDAISQFIAMLGLDEQGCLQRRWRSAYLVCPVSKQSSGCAAIFRKPWKTLHSDSS